MKADKLLIYCLLAAVGVLSVALYRDQHDVMALPSPTVLSTQPDIAGGEPQQTQPGVHFHVDVPLSANAPNIPMDGQHVLGISSPEDSPVQVPVDHSGARWVYSTAPDFEVSSGLTCYQEQINAAGTPIGDRAWKPRSDGQCHVEDAR